MTADPSAPEPAGTSRPWSDLLRVITARPPRAELGEHMRALSIGGRLPLIDARIIHWLMPRSELYIYHGGHLELATDAERMAPIVEAFLTAEGSPG